MRRAERKRTIWNSLFRWLPISQRVEMIAPMFLKAISKFCTTNELFEFENAFTLHDLSQMHNLSAFKRILDLVSKCAGHN